MKPFSVSLALLLFAAGACRRAEAPSIASPTDVAPSTSRVATSPDLELSGTDPSSRRPSTSLRNPNDGSLAGGVPLPLRAPGLRFNPKNDPRARYGTSEVVDALVRAAASVYEELGGVGVTINDLSYREGGPIPRHGSHQSGRDVDVLFYQVDTHGTPIPSVGAFFDPRGIGIDFRDLADPGDDIELRVDLARTWHFLQSLIENPKANLQSIFVAEHIRSLLLHYARDHGAPARTIARFAAMTCQPEYPHDDHFHFRFYCSLDDIEAGCRDSKPTYPWRRAMLEEAGVRPKPLLPKRELARAETVTHEEARARAGRLDPEVERWLDRRKAWLDKPHSGRRYCR